MGILPFTSGSLSFIQQLETIHSKKADQSYKIYRKKWPLKNGVREVTL